MILIGRQSADAFITGLATTFGVLFLVASPLILAGAADIEFAKEESLGVKRVVEVHMRKAYKGGVKHRALLSNAKEYDLPDSDVIDGAGVGSEYEVIKKTGLFGGTQEFIRKPQ